MYVGPAYRGAGVASRLLAELEERARMHGFRAVWPDTHDRLTEAVRLSGGPDSARSGIKTRIRAQTRWFEKFPPEFP